MSKTLTLTPIRRDRFIIAIIHRNNSPACRPRIDLIPYWSDSFLDAVQFAESITASRRNVALTFCAPYDSIDNLSEYKRDLETYIMNRDYLLSVVCQ